MTLPLRKNRRTTAQPTIPRMLASTVALLTLTALPSFAQPPAPSSPYLPLPPGYRPRTPPPTPHPAPPRSTHNGTILYFHKPANALLATGAASPLTPRLETAQASLPPTSRHLPDVAPASHHASYPPTNAVPTAQTDPMTSPMTSTSEKKQEVVIQPVPEEFIQLPPRDKIFMVYDDAGLEKAIVDYIREGLKKDKKYDPKQEKSLVFPPLPVISPPGVVYTPKTNQYPPRSVWIEPGYVVHRRLHFEERNAERAGWDLGPLQTLLSTTYFYKDVLMWPYRLASGCRSGFWDTSAGKCLPGSPTPYYLYPPGLSLTGTVVEGSVITGAAFIFP
ncbi:MAG: hypothetical protein RMJ56_17395 [Gemmataceae bacterium]|nr:hypothetical protein [Gemmata sp.]MDW8199372.1 hypothetical protein [Gemmataceae bacterium]